MICKSNNFMLISQIKNSKNALSATRCTIIMSRNNTVEQVFSKLKRRLFNKYLKFAANPFARTDLIVTRA